MKWNHEVKGNPERKVVGQGVGDCMINGAHFSDGDAVWQPGVEDVIDGCASLVVGWRPPGVVVIEVVQGGAERGQ